MQNAHMAARASIALPGDGSGGTRSAKKCAHTEALSITGLMYAPAVVRKVRLIAAARPDVKNIAASNDAPATIFQRTQAESASASSARKPIQSQEPMKTPSA